MNDANPDLPQHEPLGAHDGPYTPIDCNFHDRLESLAVRAKPTAIELRTEGDVQTVQARIADVYSREGAEYARLEPEDGADPIVVRLDRLVSVNGIPRPESP